MKPVLVTSLVSRFGSVTVVTAPSTTPGARTLRPKAWRRRLRRTFSSPAGCAYGQGYYFSRPVNAERATERCAGA